MRRGMAMQFWAGFSPYLITLGVAPVLWLLVGPTESPKLSATATTATACAAALLGFVSWRLLESRTTQRRIAPLAIIEFQIGDMIDVAVSTRRLLPAHRSMAVATCAGTIVLQTLAAHPGTETASTSTYTIEHALP